MENFDLLAKSWDNEPRRVERAHAVEDLIVKYVPGLKAKKGFEYGCGTGLLSICLSKQMGRITAGDNSEGMLAELGRKLEDSGISNIETLKIDLTEESLKPSSFDIVYTLMTLHHITDVGKVLGEFYASLKNGGYLCIADLDEEDGSFHGAGFSGHNGFNRMELEKDLVSRGFGIIKDEICYEVIKAGKKYPVFLVIARK